MKNSVSQSILKLSILFSIILFLPSSAHAAGVLDPTFGTNGRVLTSVGNYARANAVAIQPDGKIVVVGDVAEGTKRDIVTVRYNPNGSLDQSFGNGGKVITTISNRDYFASAVALQPDGKIVIAVGVRPQEIPSGDFLVIRYNPSGTPDMSFGTNGVVTLNQGTYDSANAVAVQPDGKIVVAGNTSNAAGNIAVFRLNGENGSVDTSFADGGFRFYRYNIPDGGDSDVTTKNVVILPNGRILVGALAQRGEYFIISTVASVLLMLESSGTFAQNFGSSGIAFYRYSVYGSGGIDFDLAVLPDGKILTVSIENMLFSSSGATEWTYGTPETRNTDVAVRTDGKYVTLNDRLFGVVGTHLFSPDNRLIGSAGDLHGSDIAVQPDNKIIVIGSTETGFSVIRLIAISSHGTRLANYDGDAKTDVAVLRHSNSTLYVLRSSGSLSVYPSGEASFEVRRVIPERYNNPFSFSFIYWRGGNIIGTPASFCGTNGAGNRQCLRWGLIGDIPVGGDYDGDGFTNITVYRPSEGVWYILNNSNNQFRAVKWGLSEDKPVPADYDYDGITDIAVYRPSTGTWWILRSSDGGYFTVQFGIASDIPLTGDFDGDGHADFTVYRASEGNWYQLLTAGGFRVVRFGLSTDIPVPGDYDGDGRHDAAVFREGIWYLLQSTEGFKAVHWGLSSDTPVSVRYDR